jgi:hypothetical protein
VYAICGCGVLFPAARFFHEQNNSIDHSKTFSFGADGWWRQNTSQPE